MEPPIKAVLVIRPKPLNPIGIVLVIRRAPVVPSSPSGLEQVLCRGLAAVAEEIRLQLLSREFYGC